MRKDLLGLLLLLINNNFLFFYSSNSVFFKNKFLFTITKNFYLFIYFLRFNSLCYNSTFVEFSCVENFNINLDVLISFFLYYHFILNNFNTRFCLGVWVNKNSQKNSLVNFFNNLNWSEREVSEMYGINFIFKKDNRNLLLDYNFLDSPMLKNFPSQGYEEVIFNFIDQQVEYTKILSWEGQKILEK